MANQPKKYQKFVATAATATLVATAVVPAASADELKFSDIGSYATEVQAEVEFLADLKVINGFEDGTFKPAQNITRGQAVKMIGRFLVEQGVTEVPANWETVQAFDDVSLTHPDRELVKYAAVVKEAGVFQGNGNVLNASGFTTRENMALILDRLIGQITGKTAVEWATGKTNNVSDLANAKEEAREAIAALNALGVSNAEEFKPKNNTQRVHFASFLARVIELADGVVTKVDSAKAIDEKTIEVTFKTGETTETAQFTLETPLVEGENKVTVNHKGTEYEVTVNYVKEVAKDLTISSIASINASEIKVEFSEAVTLETATDAANYEIKVNNEVIKVADVIAGSNKQDAITLSQDKKSVIIRLADAFQAGDKYVVQTNDAIKSETGKAAVKFVSDEKLFNESAAPKLLSVVPGNDTLTFEFDRPVASPANLVKVDGLDIDGVATVQTELTQARNTAGNYKYTVSVTDPQALDTIFEIGTHDVVVYDVFDTAVEGYASKASVLNAEYKITGELSVPVVEEVVAVNANRFFLRTNVPVDLTDAKIKVEKGNHEFVLNDTTLTADNAVTTNETTVDAVAGTYLNSADHGVWVVVSDDVDANDENPLYKGTETKADLKVTLENFKDAATNTLLGEKAVKTVTLDKNNSKPTVESTKVNGKALEVKFAGALEAVTTFDADDVVVRDKDGVIVTSVSNVGIIADAEGVNNTVSITVDNYQVSKEPYSVQFKAGELKYTEDTSAISTYLVNTVKNDVINTIVKTTSTNFLFTELKLTEVEEFSKDAEGNLAPKAGEVVVTQSTEGLNDTIEIAYGKEMGDSARTVANYTLDGKALPTGSTVDFVDGKDKVRIVLPAGSLKASTSYKLAISPSVKTAEESAIVGSLQTKAPAEVTLKLSDNIAPSLTSATYLRADEEVKTTTNTNYIELTFSEVVEAGTAIDGDLKVIVAGSEIDVNNVIENVDAKGAAVLDNKLIVVLDTNVNVSQAATISVVAEDAQKDKTIAITDIEGNKALSGVEVKTVGSKYSTQYAATVTTP